MLSLNSPLSLYAIPAMWVISLYPASVRSGILRKLNEFDFVQPRSSVANIKEKKSISPELAARLQRMEGAHANGLENLPFFGLAVLAGNWAGIDNKTLNIVSGSYLLWRIAYNYVYFNQSSRRTAGLRSLIWLTSMFFPFYLFFKAASLAGQRSLV